MRKLSLLVMLLLIAVLAVPVLGAQNDSGPGITGHDRELLAQAEAQGQPTVTLLVVAKPGRGPAAATAIAAKGATIRYQDDQLGYIRVVAPIGQAEAIAKLKDIQAVDVNEIIPLPDPDPEGTVAVIPQAVPDSTTPNANPYMPIQDIGGSDFMAAHPTWDGRDVRIGIVDTGVTLDHPSLQTTSTNQRKIIDWMTFTDPVIDNDPTWVKMSDTYVKGPSFTWNAVNYTAPGNKKYRIGIFNERDPRLGGEVGSDVNRDGNPGGSNGLFAVLWDVSKGTVWVDTNQNNNFADEMTMRQYGINYDVNYFGTDNPATPVKEQMPFVVQPDKKNLYVNIGIVSGAHGSHVAGIAAGNALFGGQMSGMAPGAKIVSVRACLFVAGCTNAALIEGMIYAVKSKGVDVVNMSIGGLPSLNDGNNARAVLYDRLIDQYDVQIVISAGNSGMGMNTIGDPAVASKVLAVGAYISDDTYLADYGAQLYEDDNLHYFSSRGPREDGGFKPEIVASGAAISSIPMWQAQGCLAQVCPVGYALFNGTSMAAPQATGGIAQLISAAQQAKVQHLPEQIRQAVRSSARYLTGRYQAYEQGNGLMNVPDAWSVLSAKVTTVDITSSVPVHTALSAFLATPGYGVGINDREGVMAGDSYTRTYTFRRTSGANGNKLYNVNWVDNDGTFSSAGTIVLPKNANVSFPVNINPTTSGAHSAILNLDDPGNPGIEYQTMNVVVAADQFTAGNSYTVTKSGSLGPGQFVTYFFNVPAGTPAFKVDMTGGGATVGAGAIRFMRWHPYGVGIDNNGVSNCYNPSIGGCTTGSATSRTTSNPFPGVWEVTVDARRNSDAVSAPFTLTATILGATVSPNPDVIASATVGVPVARSYTLTNIYGPFTGRGVGTALGSAYIDTPTIAHATTQSFNVTVPAGSTALRATIGSTSDPAADLDLFVYNCVSGPCVLAGSNADGDSEESVTIANPAAGAWRVDVDAYSVPAGTTTYKYIDLISNAAFGTISVTDANALRAAGASWSVPGSVTANAAPAAGRVLYGNVQVRTDTNILVGQGEVIVQSVTP